MSRPTCTLAILRQWRWGNICYSIEEQTLYNTHSIFVWPKQRQRQSVKNVKLTLFNGEQTLMGRVQYRQYHISLMVGTGVVRQSIGI